MKYIYIINSLYYNNKSIIKLQKKITNNTSNIYIKNRKRNWKFVDQNLFEKQWKLYHWNCFLFHLDISIDCWDIRIYNFYSAWDGAEIMNGPAIQWPIFFPRITYYVRKVSKKRVCRLSAIWDRSVRRGASERSE